MPRKKPRLRNWSASDLKLLKTRAGLDPVATIARKLGRTEGAVRFKAVSNGISVARKAARQSARSKR